MDPEELRLECLRLASAAKPGMNQGQVLEAARAYEDYVIGRAGFGVIGKLDSDWASGTNAAGGMPLVFGGQHAGIGSGGE